MTSQLDNPRQPLGVWFEEFEVGDVRESPGRTITEADVMAFAGVTGDYSQVHTDHEHMVRSEFGQRIVHGLLGLSIAQGLCWRTNYTDGTGIASLGWNDWRFRGPIYFGDTVHTRWWVTSKRESTSKPDAGIITEHVELRNHRDEVVQEGDHITMVRRKNRGA